MRAIRRTSCEPASSAGSPERAHDPTAPGWLGSGSSALQLPGLFDSIALGRHHWWPRVGWDQTQPEGASHGDPDEAARLTKAMLSNWNRALEKLAPKIQHPDVERELVRY